MNCIRQPNNRRSRKNWTRRGVANRVKEWSKQFKSSFTKCWRGKVSEESESYTTDSDFFSERELENHLSQLSKYDHLVNERTRTEKKGKDRKEGRRGERKQEDGTEERERTGVDDPTSVEEEWGLQISSETYESEGDGDSWHTATFLNDEEVAMLETQKKKIDI